MQKEDTKEEGKIFTIYVPYFVQYFHVFEYILYEKEEEIKYKKLTFWQAGQEYI